MKRRIVRTLLPAVSCLAAVLLLATAVPAAAEGFQSGQDAVGRAARSVLTLSVYDAGGALIATASGFVAFDNKTLVTGYRAVENADRVLAVSGAGDEYLVTRVVAADAETGVALLSFFSPTDLTPLPLDPGAIFLDTPTAVAAGAENGVSRGVISDFYKQDGVLYYRFTAAVSPAFSGGALLDWEGEVIGVILAASAGQDTDLAVEIGEAMRLWEESRNNPRLTFAEYREKAGMPSQEPAATPAPLSGIRVTATLSGVTLNWDPVQGVQAYQVYRAASAGGEWTMLGVADGWSFHDLTAVPGAAYYYRVQWAGDSGASGMSAAVRADIPTLRPAPPLTPTPKPTSRPAPTLRPTPRPTPTPIPAPGPVANVRASWTDTGILIAWEAEGLSTSYDIYRSAEEASGYALMANAPSSPYLDREVNHDGPYYYKIAGRSGELQGSVDGAAVISVAPPYTPSSFVEVPLGLKASVQAGNVTIAWIAQKNVQQYAIYRAEDVDGPYYLRAVVSGGKYVDAMVPLGRTYYYKARGLRGSAMSGLCAAITVKMPRPASTPTPAP